MILVCETCYWCHQCMDRVPCEHYDPMVEDLEEFISRKKSEFEEQWLEYLQENS